MLDATPSAVITGRGDALSSPPRDRFSLPPGIQQLFDAGGFPICDVQCSPSDTVGSWDLVPLDPGRLLDYYFRHGGRLVGLGPLASTYRAKLVTNWRGDHRDWRLEPC